MIQLVTWLLQTSRAIRFSRLFVLAALAMGLLGGAAYAAVIANLNSALSGRRGAQDVWAFAGLCLAILLTRFVSQGLFDFVGGKAALEVRRELCRRILASPPRRLEEIGSDRLVGTLTDDVMAVSAALTQIPRTLVYLAIALASLVYLGWLSWQLLSFTLGFMAIGIVSHQLLLTRANLSFRRLREQRDLQLAQLRALIGGDRGLELQRSRGIDLVRSELVQTSESIRRLTLSANALSAGASTWGNVLFFIAIALLMFAAGRAQRFEQHVVDGYTLTLLYLLLPLEQLFLSLPALGRTAVAMRQLASLDRELSASGASHA
jgi:putative ATP-binding cassette transporter